MADPVTVPAANALAVSPGQDGQLVHPVPDHGAHTVAVTEHAAPGGHVEPDLFGLAPYQIVAIAMSLLLLIMLWKRVPGMIVRGLDDKIAAIRQQLDEAKTLRAEAEALRSEYAAKIAGAEKDAEAMLANARAEAGDILAKAEADGAAMIARRERMAEDKIAAAEREAVNDLRNRVASAATQASRKLIGEQYGADADRALADKVIAAI